MAQQVTRVLAFTASAHRPLYLRHCILQMQSQTYPCTHSVFLNASEYQGPDDSTNYCLLMTDIAIAKGFNLHIAYGKQGHQHFNHVTAIEQVDINAYDLFLKIDDDDIYRSQYIEHVVQSFEQDNWDFSGAATKGVVQGSRIQKKSEACFKKDPKNLHDHPLDQAMPGTYAFSQKAMRLIIKKGAQYTWKKHYEDPTWLTWMLEDPQIRAMYRNQDDYTYVIHETNFSRREKTSKN